MTELTSKMGTMQEQTLRKILAKLNVGKEYAEKAVLADDEDIDRELMFINKRLDKEIKQQKKQIE